MEWNARWDWENLEIFGSKAIVSPKKVLATDWEFEEGEGDIDAGSFNLSGVVGGSGGSPSDVGNNSSGKSSISASAESSLKEGKKMANFTFEAFGGFPGEYKKEEFAGGELDGTSPSLEASIGSGEPFIGLKLGKRTYFENNSARSSTRTSSLLDIPISSVSTAKKVKSSGQTSPIRRCQVEGCNLELSSAKEYHRKHRVCGNHSKCPKVVVNGLERRFCQQCSRFHGLSEFDEKKRSCRRRLSDHNARRRKPHQETFQFNSASLSSSFYDGRQQLSFVLNNIPAIQTRPVASTTWESTCSSKYTLAKVKAGKAGGLKVQPQCPVIQLPHAISMPSHSLSRLPPSKGTGAEVFDHGLKESMPTDVDAALDLRRALSLLSNNSWGSSEPDFATIDHHPIHENHTTSPQHGVHAVAQPSPPSKSECWQVEQQSIDPRMHALALKASNGNNHFQLFNAPYETRFYSNHLD